MVTATQVLLISQDGPSLVGTSFRCGMCQYHAFVTLGGQAGEEGDTLAGEYCINPAAGGTVPIPGVQPGGRYIGEFDLTPGWCPFEPEDMFDLFGRLMQGGSDTADG